MDETHCYIFSLYAKPTLYFSVYIFQITGIRTRSFSTSNFQRNKFLSSIELLISHFPYLVFFIFDFSSIEKNFFNNFIAPRSSLCIYFHSTSFPTMQFHFHGNNVSTRYLIAINNKPHDDTFDYAEF